MTHGIALLSVPFPTVCLCFDISYCVPLLRRGAPPRTFSVPVVLKSVCFLWAAEPVCTQYDNRASWSVLSFLFAHAGQRPQYSIDTSAPAAQAAAWHRGATVCVPREQRRRHNAAAAAATSTAGAAAATRCCGLPGATVTAAAAPRPSSGLFNELRLQAGKSTLGSLNPLIDANAASFNDVTTGSSSGSCGFPRRLARDQGLRRRVGRRHAQMREARHGGDGAARDAEGEGPAGRAAAGGLIA